MKGQRHDAALQVTPATDVYRCAEREEERGKEGGREGEGWREGVGEKEEGRGKEGGRDGGRESEISNDQCSFTAFQSFCLRSQLAWIHTV